jgi:hypothetical protein
MLPPPAPRSPGCQPSPRGAAHPRLREPRPEQRVIELGPQPRHGNGPGQGLSRLLACYSACGDLDELVGKRGERHGSGIPPGLVRQVGNILPW